jgi:hypothetical protein
LVYFSIFNKKVALMIVILRLNGTWFSFKEIISYNLYLGYDIDFDI